MVSQKSSFFLQIAAVLLFLAVALGAFGAHGLQNVFSAKQLDVWHKAVNYQVIHGFAILAMAVLISVFPQQLSQWNRAAWSFIIGTLLFSGSLYLWAWSGVKFLVFLTPLGGTAFLIGWLFVLFGARKLAQPEMK